MFYSYPHPLSTLTSETVSTQQRLCKKLYAKRIYTLHKTLSIPALILLSDVNILQSIFYLLENICSSTGWHKYLKNINTTLLLAMYY